MAKQPKAEALAALTTSEPELIPPAPVVEGEPIQAVVEPAERIAVIGDGEVECRVLFDRYAWIAEGEGKTRWHMTAALGDVIRVSEAEADRGESLGGLTRLAEEKKTEG